MQGLENQSNRRILLIDDNPLIHEDFRKVLVSDDTGEVPRDAQVAISEEAADTGPHLDIELDVARQAPEGLQKVVAAVAENRPYAMAFVDMRKPPGWDELTTIEQLWKADPALQVVICTAYSDNSWFGICHQLGHTDRLLILKKPFDNAEVCQLASALTKKWNLARRAELCMDQMQRSMSERGEQIEDAHQESGMLLAAISSLLVGVDASGVVRRWNTSAEELFGVAAADALGKAFHEIQMEWAEPEAAERFFGNQDSYAITRRVLKLVQDGSTRMLGVSSYPVIDNDVYRGVIYLGTDITKECQLEQQLHQAQKLEAVGQLAAGVAHEINTPMQYVGDNLDFLQNKIRKLKPLLEQIPEFLEVAESTDETSELLTEMRTAVKKLKVKSFLPQVLEAIDDSLGGVHHVTRIVRAMKEFAHPGQEEQTPVDINRALESTIAVSTNEWKYIANIETNFDPSVPSVSALAGELNQAFLNILINAAHAVGDTNDGGATGKGKITISTRSSGNYVDVSIADSGKGIPDEILHRVFDPFFTTKEVGKGTGQGLAVAHSVVVQKHYGKLWCETSPDTGTTFFIQLPVEPPAETNQELEPALACD